MFGNNIVGGSSFSFSKILGGISKTLNVANQAIPIYQQAKPVFENAKSALGVIKTFGNKKAEDNKTETPKNENKQIKEAKSDPVTETNNSPVFFQ